MPGERTYEYRKSNRFFAQSADGLEDLSAAELARLGAADVKPAYRGVYFSADHETLYRINYTSRLATRVLAPLLSFDCHSARYLYKTARSIDWSDFLDTGDTFAVFANVVNSAIQHSQYAALRLKDAIADQFRERRGDRPSVDTRDPDVWFNLYIQNNHAVVSLDTSGGSLHRRGYRVESVEAPMQETVAAAIVDLSGWDGSRPLYDPMCGSGTLVCEAAMRYCRIPAAYLRARTGRERSGRRRGAPVFGFERLPDFRPAEWRSVRDAANRDIRRLPAGLVGASDASAKAIAAARANAATIPDGDRITFQIKKFQNLGPIEDATLLCNPPYGLRIGGADAGRLTGEFGDFLKQRCRGSEAYVYFGKRELVKRIGLRPSWKRPLKSGGLDGRLVKYELY
jgi:putative N6-adenine-specific DNA methylase